MKLSENYYWAAVQKSPFTHTDGQLFVQQDGVSMGSPLGVVFANYYMTHIENKILDSTTDIKTIMQY